MVVGVLGSITSDSTSPPSGPRLIHVSLGGGVPVGVMVWVSVGKDVRVNVGVFVVVFCWLVEDGKGVVGGRIVGVSAGCEPHEVRINPSPTKKTISRWRRIRLLFCGIYPSAARTYHYWPTPPPSPGKSSGQAPQIRRERFRREKRIWADLERPAPAGFRGKEGAARQGAASIFLATAGRIPPWM
jgi:hypothetical protein